MENKCMTLASTPSKPLETISPAFPVALGKRLRLVDDPLQWIVERQRRKPTAKTDGWVSIRFHRDRDALLVWAKHCGVLPEAIAAIATFPRWHL